MATRAETNRKYYLANRERLVKEQAARRAANQVSLEQAAANRERQRRHRAKRRREYAEFAEQWRRENNLS
jgi:hypothetical protein